MALAPNGGAFLQPEATLNSFTRSIRPHVRAELQAARAAEAAGQGAAAFHHLERAHVLALASTADHVRVHWEMLRWGWRHRSVRECLGQLLRIGAAALFTAFGLSPYGNTGGAKVSAFKPMPVAPELEALLQRARSGG